MEFCQVGWYVNIPVHCVWTRWVNIEEGAKFEEVSCYFSATFMRIFIVLLSNVYLHSQDFRCNFRMEYAKPGWWFLWLWEPTFLIRAQGRWQGWQTSPSRVTLVDLTGLAPGGYLLAPCLHFIPFSLVTQTSFSERCCCWPNTSILYLPEQPQQLLSAWECLSFSKSDSCLKTPLKILVPPS